MLKSQQNLISTSSWKESKTIMKSLYQKLPQQQQQEHLTLMTPTPKS